MRDKFFKYIPYNDDIHKKLWEEATFVFDANIFLNLYRYSSETKNQVISCLDKISGRVWIPYQTGKEFFENRVTTILAQEKVYSDLEKNLNMTNKINFIKRIRHTTLDSQKEKMIDIIKKCEKEINNIINEDKCNYQSLIYDDPNLDKILELFDGKVGEKISEDDYREYKKEIDKRYEAKIPPGYKDFDKSGDEKYGDAINWLEIIKFAKEKNTNIIYVTDDKKEDWVEIREGKKIGPRKELLGEFYKKTDGCIIGIYNTENFLKYSHEYLLNTDCEENKEVGKAISEIKSINNNIISIFSGSRNKEIINKLVKELYETNFYIGDFTCPDCGRTSDEGVYDSGNGFCQDCAPEH